MADESLSVQFSADQIDRLLKCAVCLDRFNTPKLLPCQHTFCQSPCLEGLVQRHARILKCPECRAEHFLPLDGVAGLPNNRTILNFLDLAGTAGSTETGYITRCQVCDQESDTFQRCSHCGKQVCNTCKKSHTTQLKHDIGRLVNQIRRGVPKISDVIGKVEHSTNQVRQKTENVKNQISIAVERHIKELKDRERMLHSEVETYLQSELRSLRLHQETLEVELASLSSYCDLMEGLLSRSDTEIPESDLVGMKSQCKDHIKQMQEVVQDGLPTPKQVRFTVEPQFVSSQITSLGELVVTSTSNTARRSAGTRRNQQAGRQTSNRERNQTVPTSLPSTSGQSPVTPLTNQVLMSSTFAHNQLTRQHGNNYTNESALFGANPFGDRYSVHLDALQNLERNRRLNTNASPGMSLSNERSQRNQNSRMTFNTDTAVARYTGSRAGVEVQRNRHQANMRQHRNNQSSIDERPIGGHGVTNNFRGLSQTHGQRLDGRTSNNNPASRNYSSSVGNADDNSVRGPNTGQNNARGSTANRPIQTRNANQIARERQREQTFVLGSTENSVQNNLQGPVRTPVTFDIPLDESLGDLHVDADMLEPSISFRYSMGDSLTVMTPRFNYQQKGQMLLKVGCRGSDAGRFTWPRGIAVMADTGYLVVADSSNHRVQTFDRSGRFISTFGSYGQGEGEFDCLAGVCVNRMGQIIISDRYNHRIQIFDRNGQFMTMFGSEGEADGELSYPWGIACDDMGFIYVCDKDNHRIQVFQLDGTFVRKFGSLGNGMGQLENPHYIAVSNDNKVVVSDSSNHRIQVFNIYGRHLLTFGSVGTSSGQFKYPRGVVVDDQGFIIVADSGNNRVQVFRGDGRFYCMFGSWGSGEGQLKGIEGVALTSDGKIVVCDRENHRLQVF